LRRGIYDYRDLFSSRQLLLMHHAMRLLQPFEQMIRLKLALLLSTSLEFNVMLCGYKGARRGDRPGAIRHAFAHHGYAFPYTALENNVLFEAKASGTLQKLYHDRLWRAQKWARQPRERRLDQDDASSRQRFVPVRGERDEGVEVKSAATLGTMRSAFMVRQGSAARIPLPDAYVDFVVTDPPYYDNVQYSDLAAFFRVWLPRLVPNEQRETWRYDPSLAAVDSFQNGNGHYGRVLGEIFAECRRVMKRGGRLIFTFHHWKPQGWAALTTALQDAGFGLVNRYVVHSENPSSVHVANLRAITDDAILVLAPVETGLQQGWERPERIDQCASNQFCRDCADLLGWLLAQKMPPTIVDRIWRSALRDGGRDAADGSY
jgi:putative DNA methylase